MSTCAWVLARTVLLGFAISVASASPALAVCVIFPLDHYLTEPDVAAVLVGTVREVTRVPAGEIVSFDVERVWKGQMPPRLVAYNRRSDEAIDEVIRFQPRERYILMPRCLAPEERRRFGIDAPQGDPLAVHFCLAWDAEGRYAREILGDAPGYPPEPAQK